MKIGRFQVMGMLQAARAYVLGLSREQSLSWGLNRAIFYAAAKRDFRPRPPGEGESVAGERERESFFLGDTMAYRVEGKGGMLFTIGGEVQKARDFERQIASRFKGGFDDAWEEALGIVRSYDREVLLSQDDFFERVYKPRRDELAEKWSELFS
ncbi:MAG: hypothetical protein FJ151_04085 [Euryarchaeota archaeon]|nr:hypothetical protein [Euryarchaeota archaeon]